LHPPAPERRARFARLVLQAAPVDIRAIGAASAAKHMNGNEVAEELTGVSTSEIGRTALTKEELQNLLFQHIGLSKRECREMVNAIFEEMRAALEAGESVKLEGFGRFQPRERPRRWARNLQSGERIAISERRVVTFHPSKKLTANIGQPASAPRESGELSGMDPPADH
jgi:integration host factor subunit alpha